MADVAVVTGSTRYLALGLVEKLDIVIVSQYYDVGAGALRESEFDGLATESEFVSEVGAVATHAGPATLLVGEVPGQR